MEIWFKNDGLHFVTTMAVCLVSSVLSNRFKLMDWLSRGTLPYFTIYLVMLLVAICFEVVQYVTMWKALGVYILFCAVPFIQGLIEGRIEG